MRKLLMLVVFVMSLFPMPVVAGQDSLTIADINNFIAYPELLEKINVLEDEAARAEMMEQSGFGKNKAEVIAKITENYNLLFSNPSMPDSEREAAFVQMSENYRLSKEELILMEQHRNAIGLAVEKLNKISNK